jgi:hypothetical protein
MRDFAVVGFTWAGHTVFGSPLSIEAVKAAVKAQETIRDLQDQRMRLEIRLKAAEDRWLNSSDNWKPGTYQNGA